MTFFRLVKIFLAVLLLSQLAAKNVYATPKKNLTIFAEPNLMLAMTQLARIYSRQSNVVVSVNFNSSEELLHQIDQGEPADLFISSHKKSIYELKQKGLADYYNIGFFAKDDLVLVGSKSRNTVFAGSENLDINSYLKKLDSSASTIITDHKGSSSGSYAIEYLDQLGFKNLKVFNKVAEDESSILKLIKDNKDQYGLLFASQVYKDEDLVILAKANKNDIFYQALVVLGYNMENAREFLRFLQSDSAREVLKKSGVILD